MLNRFFSLALSGAIVLAVGVSGGPAWCLEATQEQNLALLKAIDADLAKKPNDITFQLQHAAILGRLKRYDEQIAEANKLIRKDPKLREAYLIRSDGEFGQKRFSEANDSLDMAFKLAPPTPKLLLNKARCLKNAERYQESVEVLTQLIQVEPSNVAAYDCRSICYFRIYGPCEKALQDLEKVVMLNPSDVKAKALVSDLKRELRPNHQIVKSQTKTK